MVNTVPADGLAPSGARPSASTVMNTLIAMFMGPTWGPSGADRAQVGPVLAPWTLLSGYKLGRLSWFLIIPPATKLGGVYWIHPVCLSVCPSVCLLTFCVRPVASTVQDGFFPYLVQMINSMRGCVACDDLWPWPISSRSFGLDLENRVRSVACTVLDGFFFYLAQMITINRGCVVCYVFFRIRKFEFLANFWNFSALTLKKKIYSCWWILSIFSTNDH